MAKKSKNLTARELYAKRSLFTKVVAMLDQGKTYDYIQEFLAEQNAPMSRGTLYNVKEKLKESKELGIPFEDVLDKRKKTSITQVSDKLSGYKGEIKQADELPTEVVQVAKNKIWSTEQALDTIIEKGMRTLDMVDAIDEPILLKAIDMKEKYHGSENGGLTLQAIKQFQAITQAQLKGLYEVVMTHIPEDEQDQVYQEMRDTEQKVLDNIELSPDGRKLLVALRKEGIGL
ncbi:hypothetical protein GPK34_00425 [Secundilactobacillus kimchicus]|uniref:hypothetical protein n=1 Tax=Secundilactobacillus kimchicus TaxID=528209 RepID=UPI001C02B6A3|nr:hypothetical protein [Secundilactobacillus kimchicus]MBT9670502.1 hypothetical protein [Secundilactobacillus kimchicus]